MAGQTPEQSGRTWAQNMTRSRQRITSGVQAVTVAPGQAAARQKSAYVNNVAASADKWATNVSKVTLNDWQTAMVNKGIPRIASGAQAAEPKFVTFMGKLLPYIDTAVRNLPARGNLDQNINRMTSFVRNMAQFKNS